MLKNFLSIKWVLVIFISDSIKGMFSLRTAAFKGFFFSCFLRGKLPTFPRPFYNFLSSKVLGQIACELCGLWFLINVPSGEKWGETAGYGASRWHVHNSSLGPGSALGEKEKNQRGRKKKSKKKPSDSLGRGKSGGLSSLPRTPLGSLRSPTFFLFDPVFCLFPALRSLVPG